MTLSGCTPPLKNVGLGLLLLAGSFLAGGCVPAIGLLAVDVVRDEREPRAYWQDNKAEMDIRLSIYRTSTISDTNVSVTIWNAVVLLTGEVPDQRAIDRILDIAKSHHYTRQIVNRIELAGRTNAASRVNDSWLTGRVITALVVYFSQIFARQIGGLGRPNDVLIVFTTSGQSPNILEATKAAASAGLGVIALTGRDGGPLADLLGTNDLELRVPADSTARIQEAHGIIIHCICDLIDLHMTGETRL